MNPTGTSATPTAPAFSPRKASLRHSTRRFHTASWLETLAVLAIVAWLLPAFAPLADIGAGRDQRFTLGSVVVQGLPGPTLPAVCASHAAQADNLVRESLCARTATGHAASAVTQLPSGLSDALAQSERAFAEPVRVAEARVQALRLQQREGIGDVRDLSDQIAAIEADTRPLVERFQLTEDEERGPAPLVCAARRVARALARPADSGASDTARANALVLLAGAFDGQPATGALASSVALPADTAAPIPACGTAALAATLGDAARLMADAHRASLDARKNEAMQQLMRSAGWQWAAAMLIGLALLKASRTSIRPTLGVALSIAAWAFAAWMARVPWPFGAGHSFALARPDIGRWSAPSPVVLAMAAAALVLCVVAAFHRARTVAPRQTLSSRAGYPGLVAATGIGWLLLFDLSAHGHIGNRYLALYHQGHLWLAMLVFSVILFLRQPLGRALAWTLSIVGEAASRIGRRLGTALSLAALIAVAIALALLVGVPLSYVRQLTSELGRVWVIVGAAWFFFLRGGPLAERLARSGTPAASVLRYMSPLLFVALVLLSLMLVTHDMGPLLIAGYGAGAFIAASAAAWRVQRGGRRLGASLAAVVLFMAWIALTTTALFYFGSIDHTTAARLESLAAPLASTNDQLALVQWFQRATPPQGFGLGSVPWCGHAATARCSGVPAQIHSDYTFTALVGAFGAMAAWAAAIGTAWWLHRLVRHHARVTRGEPRLVAAAGRVLNDGQGFLSWIGVAWVVLTLCQLAVTVAGNMAVLPLTGVTFPFVSFGMSSLVVNAAFLALCMNVDLSEREAAHG